MGLGYEIPRLLKILRIRNIHTVHDMQLIHPSGLIRIGQQNNFDPIASISLAAKIYCFICRQLFGSPERVIFPSEYIKNIYGGFGFFKKSKVMVLGNPLPSDIKPTVIKSQLEPILTLVFVSQIEQYKGVVDLIKAVESLPGDWQLLIAGEGSALREATKWALNNKKIKFIGRLDQSQLEQKIWSVADLLINPSQVPESFGLVVVEAYARGVPVLAARIGALQELVGEGETGWLFKPGDRFDLRQRIEFIMANREKLLGLKSNCIQMAEKFTLGSYLEKLF
jgi:glycosyltransferase involved in cell wall biosynthesis